MGTNKPCVSSGLMINVPHDGPIVVVLSGFKENGMYKVGDVVQLRSGGSPWTVICVESSLRCIRLGAMSAGGLSQEMIVSEHAVMYYHGSPTPSNRHFVED